MESTAAADATCVASLIRICAVTAAVLVALSLVLFAVDQSEAGTAGQVDTVRRGDQMVVQSDADIDVPAPPAAVERVREQRHSSFREYVDDANDILVSPFTSIISSGSIWAQRLVTAALALLLFGLGGMFLANALPKRSHETRDWRESTTA
jgi:hypothetical protein